MTSRARHSSVSLVRLTLASIVVGGLVVGNSEFGLETRICVAQEPPAAPLTPPPRTVAFRVDGSRVSAELFAQHSTGRGGAGTAAFLSAEPPAEPRGEGAPQPAADQMELRRLIRELDADSFVTRQRATARLMELGDAAFDALMEAGQSKSQEVRMRASFILRDRLERSLRQGFAELARKPDEQRDVEYGMWLIARLLTPRLPRAELTKELDRLAQRVRDKLGPGVDPAKCDPQVAVETLRKVLFEDEGFRGAVTNYTNPENSCLDRVLKRKQGLPILLSHVTIAVARRLGWPLVGVPTPGRYMVRYDGQRAPAGFPRQDIYIDAFGGGRVVTLAELIQMFPGITEDDLRETSSNAEILIRMLNNLETHLYQAGNRSLAELVVICKVELQNAAPLD